VGGCAAVGVVMQKLVVRGGAERGIPCGAQDQAVPRLVYRARGHADHLVVAQRGCTAAQPLAQAGLDERARLPRTRFEHSRGKIEVRHRGIRPIEPVPAPAPHVVTVCGGSKAA